MKNDLEHSSGFTLAKSAFKIRAIFWRQNFYGTIFTISKKPKASIFSFRFRLHHISSWFEFRDLNTISVDSSTEKTTNFKGELRLLSSRYKHSMKNTKHSWASTLIFTFLNIHFQKKLQKPSILKQNSFEWFFSYLKAIAILFFWHFSQKTLLFKNLILVLTCNFIESFNLGLVKVGRSADLTQSQNFLGKEISLRDYNVLTHPTH